MNKGKEVLHPEVIYISGSKDTSFAEIALQYNASYNENILSFANNIHTGEGGMHELGFKNSLSTASSSLSRRETFRSS